MERLFTFILSFITGFADTVGYIALSGLFIAQITGNLVLVGNDLISGEYANSLNRLLMIPVFGLGAALASRVSARLLKALHTGLPTLLVIEGVLLLLFAGLGHYLQVRHHALGQTDLFFIATAGTLAMAVQNASVREYFPGYVSTTVMTTNLTQFSVDVAGYLAEDTRAGRMPADGSLRQQRVGRLRRYGTALLGFTAGAAGGAWLSAGAGMAAALVPAVLTLVLAGFTRYATFALPDSQGLKIN